MDDTDNVKAKFIDSVGNIVNGNGNSGVTHYIAILPGETITFSGYISSWGGYSGLYDINKNPIQGTFIQSGTITYVPGAFYVRFSGSSAMDTTNLSNYAYSLDDPLIQYEKYAPKIQTKYLPSSLFNRKPIICIGDSIANGIAGKLVSVLTGYNISAENHSVGGESCLDTMARLGAIPYVISPFTIPSDTTPVVVNITSKKGYTYIIDNNTGLVTSEGGDTIINPYGTLPCSIAGVEGTLTFTRNSNSTGLQSCSFTRAIAGSEVVVSRYTDIKPLWFTKDATVVCFMGTNGGWKTTNGPDYSSATLADADNLVSFYKKIRDFIRPNNYIFLGFYETSITTQLQITERKAWWDYFEDKMSVEFGQHYIPIRKYFMTSGWKDAGFSQLTAGDIDAIKQERIPLCVRSAQTLDQVHLNTNASIAAANKVLELLYYFSVIDSLIKIPLES